MTTRLTFLDLDQATWFVFLGSDRGPFLRTGEKTYRDQAGNTYECGTLIAWVRPVPTPEASG
jgi:hypothetical protein